MSGRRAVSNAVILAVGSELLTPDRFDTNSLYLTRELNRLGVGVRVKLIVGDESEDLAAELRHAVGRAALVIVTGGLGATADDITRETVASVFGLPLEEDAGIVASIRARFAARGLEMPPINRRQALVPRGASVLENPKGTAPGLWIAHDDGWCAVLPGPPRELEPMFRTLAADQIAPRAPGGGIARRRLIVVGATESHIESLTHPVYAPLAALTPAVRTGVLASLGQVELHLSAAGPDDEVAGALDAAVAALAGVLGVDLVSTDGAQLETVVGRLLSAQGATVALAESCTGGLIASRLTDVPGSSAYVRAGWVAYSNEAKTDQLAVDADLIAAHGAVSQEVAQALAVGARRRAGVDYALGVTGIAGPGGGSRAKPVGTVYVALAGPGDVLRVRRLQLPGERAGVKFQTSQAALDLLRRALLR